MRDWIDDIEAQADSTTPYYLPQLIAEIRALRNRVEMDRQRIELYERTMLMLSRDIDTCKAVL